MLNTVFAYKRGECAYCVFFARFGKRRIDDGGVEHFSRAVDNGDFASVSISRIKAHRHLSFDRRLHEQRLEIEAEHFYRAVARHVGESASRLALH